MIDISIVNPILLLAYWLCFSHWIAVLMTIPLFDESAIPVTVKVLLCLVLSYALFPNVKEVIVRDIHYIGSENFWFLTIYYSVTGLVIGFLAKMIMSIFVAAGNIMTQQIGFSTVAYFDPSLVSQVGPIEQIIRWTILIMIISSGALLPIFKGVLLSFDSFSIYKFSITNQTYEFLNIFFKDLVKMALLLAAPVMVTNLFMNCILGVIARFVPQMNVFMISFVINIGFGLLVFYFTGQEFFYYGYKLYVQKLGDWFQFVI